MSRCDREWLTSDLPLDARRLRLCGFGAAGGSLLASLILVALYREMGGPGDQLAYFRQAAHLLPFTDHYYGPGYFLALRLIHDLTHADWFVAAKLTSWLSAGISLILCKLLFERLLGTPTDWLALMLVALSPTFIGQSYAAATVMFGTMWVLGGILLTINVFVDRPARWLGAGVVFGIAYLTRFQALGLLVGALIGTVVQPVGRMTARAKRAAALLIGAALPVLLWRGVLLWTQGYVPENDNFVHLSRGLGQFESFSEVPDLVKQYGSVWGVLRSSWWAPLRIAAFAAKEAVKFPFGVAFHLVFIAAGWFVPGLAVVLARREAHGPWLGAFGLGLVLTGIGSREWLVYYLVFVPFVVIVITHAIQRYNHPGASLLGRASWWVVIVSTAIWSPLTVRSDFLNTNWPEFAVARRYIEARRDSTTVISTTAGGFRYGTSLPFVRLSEILGPGHASELVSRLREQHVTYLVVTERHTPFVFPELAYLLDDSVPRLPTGLRRDTLIVQPQRLAIYRVLPP